MKKQDVVVAIVFVLFGMVLGFMVNNAPYLTLDLATKPIELINLVVVVLVAILVPKWLTSRVNDRRAKKDLLISEFEEFMVLLDSRTIALSCIENFKDNRYDELIELNKFIKNSRAMIRMIKNQLKSLTSTSNLICISEFETKLDEYWRYTTGDNGLMASESSPSFCRKQSHLAHKLRYLAKTSKFVINEL